MKRILLLSVMLLSIASWASSTTPQAMHSNTMVDVNGQAYHSIPIDVPLGVNNLQPEVSLSYNSALGTNHLGKGWSIRGLSQIQRIPRNQNQDGTISAIGWDYNDRFSLDGQRLIAIKNSSQKTLTSMAQQNQYYGKDNTTYHTAKESWMNIVSKDSEGDGPKRFVVTTKEGKVYKYGSNSNSRVLAQGRSEVRFWLLDSIIDPYGNTMVFTYLNEGSSKGAWYPDEIKYNYNAKSKHNFQRVVKFNWESRKDSVTSYINDTKSVLTKRLKSIQTLLSGKVIKEYSVKYQSDLSPLALMSMVESIQECYAGSKCLEPLEYKYQIDSKINFKSKDSWNTENDTTGLWTPMDVNGDGMDDIVNIFDYKGKKAFITYISLGTGVYSKKSRYTTTQSTDGDWLGMDSNGDGLTDIVRAYNRNNKNLTFKVFLSNGDGTYRDQDQCTMDYSKQGFIRAGDFDGNGRGDIIQFSENPIKMQVFLSSNGRGQFKAESKYKTKVSDGYQWNVIDINGDGQSDVIGFTKSKINAFISKGTGDFSSNKKTDIKDDKKDWIFGDFNGDGLGDMVNYFPNSGQIRFKVYFSKGNGFFKPKSSWKTDKSDKGEWKGLDANGDGKTDIVRIYSSTIKYAFYLSKGNGEFIKPTSSYSTSKKSGDFIPMDANGDGISDIVRLSEDSGKKIIKDYISTTTKKDLLTSIDNKRGLTKTFSYTPTSDATVYSRGETPTYPYKIIQGGQYVVSNLQQKTSKITLNEYFKYSGLQIRQDGLGLMGFESKTVTSEPDSTKTTTTFNQEYPYNGFNKSVLIKRISDSKIMGKSKFIYYFTNQKNSNPYFNVYQVLLANTYEDNYYFGKLNFVAGNSFDYDTYGNLTQLLEMSDTSDVSTYVYTNSAYHNDTNNWYIGFLTGQKVGKRPSETMHSWESSLNLKWDVIAYHSNMGVKEKKSYENSNAVFYSNTYGYDDYGNVTSTVDPLGSKTTIVYESQYHTFKSKTTSPKNNQGNSLVTTYSYNAAFGLLTQQIDPNGKVTNYCTDSYGRITSLQVSIPSYSSKSDTPCVSTSSPVATVQKYSLSSSGDNALFKTYTRNSWSDSDDDHWNWKEVEKDPFDREVQTKELGLNGKTKYVKTSYYDNGSIKQKTVPYFSGDNKILDKYYYNAYGTLIKVEAAGIVTTFDIDNLKVTKTTAKGTPDAVTHKVFIDTKGKVVKRQDPDNSITRFSYDLLGRPDTIIDPSGIKNITQYNSIGQKISVSNPDRGKTRYTYTTKGLLQYQIMSNSDTLLYKYDDLARVTQRTSKNKTTPIVTQYSYDDSRQGFYNNGFLTKVTQAIGGDQQFNYTYNYDYGENVVQQNIQIRGLSETFTFNNQYDPQGQATQQTLPDGSISTFDFYSNGFLQDIHHQDNIKGSLQSSIKHVHFDSYTALSQPTALTYYNGDSVSYEYDGNKQVLKKHSVFNAKNTLIKAEFSFNDLFQITQISDKRKQSSGTNNESQKFYYSNVGRLDSARANGTYGYKHYTYASDGSITLKDGITFTNATGHRVSTGTKNKETVYSAQYDNTGNIKSKVVDGVQWNYTWNTESNLTSITKNNSSAFSYLYDDGGTKIWEKNHIQNTQTFYVAPNFEIQINTQNKKYYTKYLNGLNGKAVSITNPDNKVTITSSLDTPPSPLFKAIEYAEHTVHSLSESINPTGSPLTKWSLLFGVALIGMLVLFVKSQSVRSNWTSVVSPVALWAIVFITVLPAELQAQMISPSNTQTETLYYHHDQVRSLSVVTNASGAQVFRGVYTPFGDLVSNKSQNVSTYVPSFATGEWDGDAGLYYMGARYYDPYTARFISADTQVGKSVYTHDAFNRYAYAGGNPVEYIDPSGHLAFIPILIAIGVGMAVGAVVNGVVDLIIQASQNGIDNVNWKQVGFSALIGGIAGAVGGGVGGLLSGSMTSLALFMIKEIGSLALRGIGMGIGLVSGAAAGVSAQFTANVLTNAIFKANIPLQKNLWKAALIGGVLGGVGGAWGAARMSSSSRQIARGTVKRYAVNSADRRGVTFEFNHRTFAQKYEYPIEAGFAVGGEGLTASSYNEWYSNQENEQSALSMAFGVGGFNQPAPTFFNGIGLLENNESNGDMLEWMESVDGVIKQWVTPIESED